MTDPRLSSASVDALYDEHPELYDAIQSEWDYDRDVRFVREALARHGVAGVSRLLEVGCGTGEHTRRFLDTGFDVTGVDPADSMLAVAREKCDADFRRGGLPDPPVSGIFDAAVAIRGVVNHLAPEELDPALGALAERLRDGGVLVFDNSSLPADGNEVALDVGDTEHGRYARVARMQPREDGRLDWCEATFTAADAFVNRRPMTPFSDDRLRAALFDAGFAVETHDGYGPDDRRTVFVAVREDA